MQVIEDLSEMQTLAIRLRVDGRLLALVPTMGSLHEGHLSLIDTAKTRADVCVVSLFVNPTQFGPNEDFESYPRQRSEDIALCEARGADIVFAPRAQDIYPPDFSTYIIEEKIGKGLEGVSRPGHFRGVTTVVAILFNLCRPDVAIFGQKDAQQAAIIKRMVRDLRFATEVVVTPTVRESDGLAMSSRNIYLEPNERVEANKINAALQTGKQLVAGGTLSVERVKAEVVHHLSQSRRLRVIYVEVVDPDTMEPERSVRPGRSLLVTAVWLDRTRLIDNLVL
ncbi:MAG: pantoate--beta-alanine ligase [Opitutales bacterium]